MQITVLCLMAVAITLHNVGAVPGDMSMYRALAVPEARGFFDFFNLLGQRKTEPSNDGTQGVGIGGKADGSIGGNFGAGLGLTGADGTGLGLGFEVNGKGDGSIGGGVKGGLIPITNAKEETVKPTTRTASSDSTPKEASGEKSEKPHPEMDPTKAVEKRETTDN